MHFAANIYFLSSTILFAHVDWYYHSSLIRLCFARKIRPENPFHLTLTSDAPFHEGWRLFPGSWWGKYCKLKIIGYREVFRRILVPKWFVLIWSVYIFWKPNFTSVAALCVPGQADKFQWQMQRAYSYRKQWTIMTMLVHSGDEKWLCLHMRTFVHILYMLLAHAVEYTPPFLLTNRQLYVRNYIYTLCPILL